MSESREAWQTRRALDRDHTHNKVAWEAATRAAIAAGATCATSLDPATGRVVVTLERVPEGLHASLQAVWFVRLHPSSEVWVCKGPPGHRPPNPNRAQRRAGAR